MGSHGRDRPAAWCTARDTTKGAVKKVTALPQIGLLGLDAQRVPELEIQRGQDGRVLEGDKIQWSRDKEGKCDT